MWFKFPPGTDQISVEQQHFAVEVEDDGGRYFRAPDHFAPTILNLPGFTRSEQPKGAPPDLPKEDPSKPSPLDQLAKDHDALREEHDRIREENKRLSEELAEVTAERDELKKQLKTHLADHKENENKPKAAEGGTSLDQTRPVPRAVPSPSTAPTTRR